MAAVGSVCGHVFEGQMMTRYMYKDTKHMFVQNICTQTSYVKLIYHNCKSTRLKNVKGCRDGMPKSMQTR